MSTATLARAIMSTATYIA